MLLPRVVLSLSLFVGLAPVAQGDLAGPESDEPAERAFHRGLPFPSAWDLLDPPDYALWTDMERFRPRVEHLQRLLAEPPLPSFEAWSAPSAQGPWLAPENGRHSLRAVRIHVVRRDVAFQELIADYGRAMASIPPFDLWIVVIPSLEAEVQGAVGRLDPKVRDRVHVFPLEYGFGSLWAKDGSRTGFDGVYLDVTGDDRGLGYPNEELTRDALARRVVSPLAFAGGDAPLGDGFAIVGPDVVRRVSLQTGVSGPAVIERLSRELGRRTLLWGVPFSDREELDPLAFHLDLALTFAVDQRNGEEVIVVQSPRLVFEQVLGIRDLDEALTKSLETFSSLLGVAIQRLLMRNDPEGHSSQVDWTESEQALLQTLWRLHPLDWYVRILAHDLAAKQLSERTGKRIVRIPGIVVEKSERWSEEVFSYTNVVLSPGHALLGSLNVRFLDPLAAQVYRDLGYRVAAFPSMESYRKKQGLLSCASEVHRYAELRSD